MSVFSLPVPGASLWCEVLGPIEAPPVLVLHGGPGADSRYLRPQLDGLRSLAPIRLVYFDQRGAERSPLEPGHAPGGYQTHVADVDVVRATLGVEQIDIVGYSWGGLLALLYALAHPERIRRLTLISPAPTWAAARIEMQHRLQQAAQRPVVQQLREAWLAEEAQLDPDLRRRRRFALAVAGYFVDPRLAIEMTPFRVVQKVEAAIWASLGDYDLRPSLHQLRHIPSLVVHGREDVIPLASASDTAERVGAELVVLDACGHVPFVEAPHGLWRAIQRFWQQTDFAPLAF